MFFFSLQLIKINGKKKKNMFFFLKKKLHKILNTILLANQFFFDTVAWFFPTLKCFMGLPLWFSG